MRTQAGRYTLADRVLDGAGWSYWCGYDSLLRRPVGLLVMEPDFAGTSEVLAGARTGAAVEDPRAQRVLDVLTDDEGTCLVVEWTPGTTIEDLLASGPLPDVESWRVVQEVARVMAAAEAAGLRHGALAPRWVLRGDGGRVRVLGLGTASPLERAGGGGGSASESTAGSAVDDVTGIGLLLYACLTGRWAGDPARSALPAAPTQGGHPARPSRVRAGVPPALDELTSRSLGLTSRAPRPASVADLVNTLATIGSRMRGFDASDPVELDPEVLAELVDTGYVQAVMGGADAAEPGSGLEPPTPRRRGIRLLGVVAALAALCVLAGLWLTTRPPATAAPAPEPTTSSSSSASAPTGALIPIRAVHDFDPLGNGTENPAQVPFAWDRSPTTAWHTVIYFNRPDLGGLKAGVGLLVDLGSPQTVGSVTLRLVGYGTWVQLRAGPVRSNVPDDYVPVAHEDQAGQVATLRPDEPVRTRYMLIWLTRLPVAPDGTGYMGGVADIQVRGS